MEVRPPSTGKFVYGPKDAGPVPRRIETAPPNWFVTARSTRPSPLNSAQRDPGRAAARGEVHGCGEGAAARPEEDRDRVGEGVRDREVHDAVAVEVADRQGARVSRGVVRGGPEGARAGAEEDRDRAAGAVRRRQVGLAVAVQVAGRDELRAKPHGVGGAGPKDPVPVPRRIETESVSRFDIARSRWPSASKSAIATDVGPATGKLVAGSKTMVGGPMTGG